MRCRIFGYFKPEAFQLCYLLTAPIKASCSYSAPKPRLTSLGISGFAPTCKEPPARDMARNQILSAHPLSQLRCKHHLHSAGVPKNTYLKSESDKGQSFHTVNNFLQETITYSVSTYLVQEGNCGFWFGFLLSFVFLIKTARTIFKDSNQLC